MLNRLKRFFAATDDAATDDQAVLHLAAAVLLVEVAKADHSLQESDLVEVAHDTAEADVSLHRQIDLINRHFTAGQKLDLVRGLWEVACADGEIHHHEEALIRRLADLIYVSHTDFIRSKHRALDNA
jgi:uncharacterized tellurite resistance protein B-like protein